MRHSTATVEADPYWQVTNNIRATALRLLTLGNTWHWPRWANGFEYIDVALRTARMAFFGKLTSADANTLLPWLVRQAIYHDDLEDTRLHGIVEIQHWGDLLGNVAHTAPPAADEPLAYWLLSRVYGPHLTTLHRTLHGDAWCSWRGLAFDRDAPIDLRPLNELLGGAYHPVLNPLEPASDEVTLPCDLDLAHDGDDE